jgi:hypothetical protein
LRKCGFNGHNGYGGATGAIQPFGNPLKKEEILHVMPYVKSPKK